jgi:hypothetical protein
VNAEAFEREILRLTAARGPGKTICPSEAAKAAAGPDWNRFMPLVRQVAIVLARAGRIVITRRGKPVDPDDFKGVYRLGAPAGREP